LTAGAAATAVARFDWPWKHDRNERGEHRYQDTAAKDIAHDSLHVEGQIDSPFPDLLGTGFRPKCAPGNRYSRLSAQPANSR
jgi:hypothetical protein